MFAASGSRMNAAISPGNFAKAASSASASLWATTVVSAAEASGTPGLPAIPSVATPEPADTRNESPWPWYPPAVLTIRARPVAARASRIADIVASVPELTKRTISIDGTIETIFSASLTSSSVGAPNEDPCRIERFNAFLRKSGMWPKRCGP